MGGAILRGDVAGGARRHVLVSYGRGLGAGSLVCPRGLFSFTQTTAWEFGLGWVVRLDEPCPMDFRLRRMG